MLVYRITLDSATSCYAIIHLLDHAVRNCLARLQSMACIPTHMCNCFVPVGSSGDVIIAIKVVEMGRDGIQDMVAAETTGISYFHVHWM